MSRDVADFEADVIERSRQIPVLVDFWAEWCGPCKAIAPTVHEIARLYDGQLVVGKLDVDANPGIPGQFGVLGIPTLLLFKEGKLVERQTGLIQKDKLITKLKPHLS